MKTLHSPGAESAPLVARSGTGAPVVNMTPEMIRCGVRVLGRCNTDDDLELIAVTVYEAMARAID